MKKWKIVMTNGSSKMYDYCGGLRWKQAYAICETYNWEWMDEFGIVWDLSITVDNDLYED